MPYGRTLNLYLMMLREFANPERAEMIDEALEPPADWRHPVTGLPAGWESEEDDWAGWEQAARS